MAKTLSWEGKALPQTIELPPEMLPGLSGYWEAYNDLVTERGGMGDGYIPWSKVQHYGEVNGYHGWQLDELHQIIRELDRVHHELQDKKREREQSARERKAKAQATK